MAPSRYLIMLYFNFNLNEDRFYQFYRH
jgi:hypothetical protein